MSRDPGCRLADVLPWVVELHRGQTRKGGDTPYVAHLLAVCALVLEYGGDETQAVAALLHDAVEDAGGDTVRAAIRERCGEAVLAIVEGCTDADTVPKPPWRERKERFLVRLAGAPPEVKLVVAADKLHNAVCTLRDLREHGPSVWGRFRGGRDGTLWYYAEAVRALGTGWTHPILDEVARVTAALDAAGRAA